MTPEQLKASILQYAIQGKLVEQRQEEGTGEELYRQIQAEKQRLIKEGKIKKEKPLAEITDDEIPFDIPDSWKWVRLPEIGTSSLGKTLNKGLDAGNEVPYLCSINVYWDGINLNQIKTAKFTVADMEKYLLRKGDLLICEGGDVGRSAVWDRDMEMYYQNALHCVRFFGQINPYYFKYCFELYKHNRILENASKGMTIKHLVQGSLYAILFPLPPLAEQKRIVAKIEELLPYVDRYAAAYEKLEQFNAKFPEDMKKSILQYAIQGKLVEQRPEEGTGEDIFKQLKPYHKGIKPCKDELNFSSMDFDIPESWTMVELNQIFDFVDYRGKTPTKITSGVFLITASNIKQGYMDYTRKEYISFEEYKGRQSRGLTQKGDLLFTTEAPMGNAALCDLDECSCGQRIITFKEYTKEATLPALFMYFILSPQFQQQLLDNCTGTTAKGIKAEKLKHFLLPLPPYEEQKRIVAKLEEILPLCERLK